MSSSCICLLALPLVYDVCCPAAHVATCQQARQSAWATMPVCGRGKLQPDRVPQGAAVVFQ